MGKKVEQSITSGLVIGALGVVFGDIGTSPLYALQAVFGIHEGFVDITHENILGILSLIIWVVTIEVTIKYIALIMRIDNQGEGGIITLISLLKSRLRSGAGKTAALLLGLVGVALFYGDSLITPAISVLSAVEGMHVIAPSLTSYILPITVALISGLFAIQRYGTGAVGKFFGPIMLLWFYVIGLAGLLQVINYPSVLEAFSPLKAVAFIIQEPVVAFFAMSAVTLAVTGAEALYADMGHFGRKPIARAWVLVVFPALTLCYLGQGALLMTSPSRVDGLFFYLFPEPLRAPVVVLAALATLIASQAVISGAFSLTKQAIQLDFLPKMLVRHTSEKVAGQVYLPFLNTLLYMGVITLVLVFESSQKLAAAYGIAVSMTLLITTVLYVVVLRRIMQKPLYVVMPLGFVLLLLDGYIVSSNMSKVLHGGWIPLIIASGVLLIITTWTDGKRLLIRERQRLEGSLSGFVRRVHKDKKRLTRVPGDAVIIGHHAGYAPLALHTVVERIHGLHERVVLVTVEVSDVAHVKHEDRIVFDPLDFASDGMCHVTLRYGYQDSINVPRSIKSLHKVSKEIHINTDRASYFVSLGKVIPDKSREMSFWRKRLFAFMSNNATTATDFLKLPAERTVELRTFIEI